MAGVSGPPHRLGGGGGMRRGRRDPADLRVGNPLDFWRVEMVEQGRAIRLRAEMRVPGRAWLEFKSQPHPANRPADGELITHLVSGGNIFSVRSGDQFK